MWPFSRKQSPRSFPPLSDQADEWSVAEGRHDGQPIVVRLNAWAHRHLRGHPDLPLQVGIAIPFLPEDGAPQPAPSIDRLIQLEDAIGAQFDDRRTFIMVAVISTPRMREFVAYTSDPDRIQHALPQLRASNPDLQIQCIVRRDPAWSVLDSIAP
ncbi:MAG: DUF695 domain-containing protein [Phycisphaeraceae bacterium]|nr:DUF695 domain-containing protein [Phycisphaeraceae bacterium]